MKTVTIKIEGMTCGGCVKSVTRVLQALEGVQTAEVSLDPAQAVVAFDETRLSEASIKEAIEDAGYDVIA